MVNKELLNSIKEEIYSAHIDKSDEDFVRLIKLNNIDKELFEVLILIHSNYKAEMQNVKTSQVRIMSKLVDYLMTMKSKEDVKSSTGDNLNLLNMFTYLNPKVIFLANLAILSLIGVFWLMFSIDPVAADWFIKVINTFVKKD